MEWLGKRLAVAGAMALTIIALSSVQSIALAQQTDDPVKIEMYKRFTDNRLPNPTVAYQAARDYVTKYNKDNDQYTVYLKKWIAAYERDDRKRNLPTLINEKKFAEAFSTGAKILADEPDDLRTQIDLGYAGYLAASANNEQFNTTATNYARSAIHAIESGQKPTDWAPFKSKDDTLAYLNYALGFLLLQNISPSNPTTADQAIESLIKAAKYESDIKKTPSTYYFLAAAYESGPYKNLSTSYQNEFAGKPETTASKAALDKLNILMDLISDAYARAVAALGTDPKTEQNRREWRAQLSNYYKFRHDGTEAGLSEFVAGALQRPLPARP